MYNAKLTDSVVKKVKTFPEIEYIEAGSKVKASSVQTNAPWGLCRISQRAKLGTTRNYHYDGDGTGVSVYVIDSGIYIKHPEFEGLARFGKSFVGDNSDESGHGTNIAGNIGFKTYGVAKNVDLVAVKVLDRKDEGHTRDVIAGIDWAIGNKKGHNGNIINLSIENKKRKELNDAVKAARRNGFVVIVAAGNKKDDACNYSPASERTVITVAATDLNDTPWVSSNWGQCVDIYAPGVDIISTSNDGGLEKGSGTSMAAAHVSGIAASLLSKASAPPVVIENKLLGLGTKHTIPQPGRGTVNLIAYNGYH